MRNLGAVVRPRAFNSSSRLSDCSPGFEKSPLNVPLNVLPPSRGTALMRTPPLSCSAIAVDVVTVVSATVAGFKLVIQFPAAINVPKYMPSRSC